MAANDPEETNVSKKRGTYTREFSAPKRIGLQLVLLCCISLLLCLQCTAKKDPKPGARSQVVYKTLDILHLNKSIFEKLVEDPPRGKKAVSSKKLHRKLQVEEHDVYGFSMLTLTASTSGRKHIFYLHGGAYVSEANSGHRKLIERLALDYGYRVTFINYPLAPEHDILTSLNVLAQAYQILLQTYEGDVFYLAGDSAGGGLALAFLQRLRDKDVQSRPGKTVLFSPWLDVSMSNPGIDTLVEKDVLLDKAGLVACGELYAGGLDLQDPRLSPLYGNLDDLSQIKVFVSTHELFYPDCMRLIEKTAGAKNTYVHLSVKERLVHDWVILPLRERDNALRELAAFL